MKRSTWFATCLLALAAAQAPAEESGLPPSPSEEKLFETKALSLEQQGQWDRLMQYTSQWTGRFPSYYPGWVYLCRAAARIGDYALTAQSCEKVADIGRSIAVPARQTGEARLLQGEAQLILHAHEAAREACREALKVGASKSRAWQCIGDSYLLPAKVQLQYTRQALMAVDAMAASSSPAGTGPVTNPKEALAQAAQAYGAAIESDGSNAALWHRLGQTHMLENRHAQARDAFARAVREEDAYPDGWLSLGQSMALSGDLQEAEQLAARIEKRHPQQAQSLFAYIRMVQNVRAHNERE